jgi:TPR repeat protein
MPFAQMNLGLLYAEGRGVPLDYTKAIFFFRNAADRNDSYAQYNLGWVYESGKGVPKDTQQAIEWYSKAVDGGNPLARARLEGLTAGKSFWGVLFRHIGLFGRQ